MYAGSGEDGLDFGGWKKYKNALEDLKKAPPASLFNVDGSKKAQRRWNPYSNEGGSMAAICGENFAVMASDTRVSYDAYAVLSRFGQKVFVLSEIAMFGGSHFQGDLLELQRRISADLMIYEFNYRQKLPVNMLSQYIARLLYRRRFFPYLADIIVAGIDADGKGAVYAYDPVGNIERVSHSVCGVAMDLMQPFLDNQLDWCTQADAKPELTLDRAKGLLRDAFRTASDRDTTTGDRLLLTTIVAGQPPLTEEFRLPED